MLVEEFDYDLPKELIAQYPSEKREESNLLVLHRDTQEIEHRKFYNIVEYLSPGDVLILNETKVIPARLIGKRIGTGGKVEVFLLTPTVNTDPTCADEWEILISPHRAKKIGVKVEFGHDFWGEIKSIAPKTIFKFYCNEDLDALIYKYGQIPLPPYIKRKPEFIDYERYQTVYARVLGASAAPTAGLHFTRSILNQLKSNGIEITKIVLHTGFGTFKPIKCKIVEEHKMEAEYYEIPQSTANKINFARCSAGSYPQQRKIVAVGTTTVRVLETIGYPLCSTKGWTDKFIYPSYNFKVVDALITNFHLPKSTLLLLVCAFASKELIFKAYREAIARGYKFYSYGDAMLII